MESPQRMVITSLISSIVLLTGIYIWIKTFPKKKPNYFFLTILFSIPPILSIFRPGVYESGDFNIHLYRTISFFNSLKEGNLMPSWAGGLNAGYGYPLFIFNYTLPYYFISLFKIFIPTFVDSLKFFLAFNFILSGLGMYLFAKQEFKKEFTAFVVAILYLFAPYHLIDLHFKVVIGEIMSFTILPFVFLFLKLYLQKNNLRYLMLSSVFFGFLIMSHVVIALFSAVFFIFYVIFLSDIKYKRKLTSLIILLTTGSLISLPQWLGPLILNKYSFINIMKIETPYFPKIYELLFSPWRFGLLFQGPYGEISFLAGYTHIFILAVSIYLFFKHKLPDKKNSLFWIIVCLSLIFCITEPSRKLWESIATLRIVGPQRLLILLAFSVSMLAGSVIKIFDKKKYFVWAIVGITIYSTILNWGQRRMVENINDRELFSNLPYATYQGEAHFYANTIWADPKNPWLPNPPGSTAEILQGVGQVRLENKTSTVHKYTVIAESELKIRENTLYFPGWILLVNGKRSEVMPGKNGIINFTLPKGNYNFDLKYEDLLEHKIIKIISSIIFILIILYLISSFLFSKRFPRNN